MNAANSWIETDSFIASRFMNRSRHMSYPARPQSLQPRGSEQTDPWETSWFKSCLNPIGMEIIENFMLTSLKHGGDLVKGDQ
jgi:hypothetical protein